VFRGNTRNIMVGGEMVRYLVVRGILVRYLIDSYLSTLGRRI
jgi:hypothetical protein